jgi:regulator of CtrA degradation
VSKRVMSKVSLEVVDGVTASPISFGERFQASGQFDQVFKEGMALVERTAAYLDGEGRKESKNLAGFATVLYATESMRLTTRLLDLASWLLIRRGLKDGEITQAEAERKRARVKLQAIGRPSHIKGFDDLPEGLRDLITQSFALHDRIVQLDRAMTKTSFAMPEQPVANAVNSQFRRLELAFSRPN